MGGFNADAEEGAGEGEDEDEDEDEDDHDDVCALCLCPGELLMCTSCPRVYHLACVEVSIHGRDGAGMDFIVF